MLKRHRGIIKKDDEEKNEKYFLKRKNTVSNRQTIQQSNENKIKTKQIKAKSNNKGQNGQNHRDKKEENKMSSHFNLLSLLTHYEIIDILPLHQYCCS